MYRDSKRRSFEPQVPSYPSDWMTRRVGRLGTTRVHGDVVFVGGALVGQIVGLKYESGLRWRVYFFGVDLDTIEIASLNDAYATEAGADAVDAVTLQRQRALKRANNGVHRSRAQKRTA